MILLFRFLQALGPWFIWIVAVVAVSQIGALHGNALVILALIMWFGWLCFTTVMGAWRRVTGFTRRGGGRFLDQIAGGRGAPLLGPGSGQGLSPGAVGRWLADFKEGWNGTPPQLRQQGPPVYGQIPPADPTRAAYEAGYFGYGQPQPAYVAPGPAYDPGAITSVIIAALAIDGLYPAPNAADLITDAVAGVLEACQITPQPGAPAPVARQIMAEANSLAMERGIVNERPRIVDASTVAYLITGLLAREGITVTGNASAVAQLQYAAVPVITAMSARPGVSGPWPTAMAIADGKSLRHGGGY